MERDGEQRPPSPERVPERTRYRDEDVRHEAQGDHAETHASEEVYRPRPGDHIVEPLFGALVEEHAEFEVVEEEFPDGRHVSHLERVWRRVRLFWRR